MKNIPIILSALSLALLAPGAYAHNHSHAAPSQVYKGQDYKGMAAIDPQPQFEFSITPMLLKAGASNLNYVIFNKELPVQAPSWTEQELKPDFSFGFALEGRYIFPEGHDVSLDWTHLSSSTSSSLIAPSASYFLGPDYEIGPNSTDIRSANGRAEFKYDVINLSAGQLLNFGRHVSIHLFGGLSDGLLREEIVANFAGNLAGVFAGPFNMEQVVTAKYTGIGPRLGVDANYHTDCGLSFYGEGAASALIGSSYAKTSFNGTSPEVTALFGTPTNPQFIGDQNVMQVVPGFDAKLGVDFSHGLRYGINASVGAGYEAAVYVNAINQYLPGSLVTGTAIDTGGIFVATMSHTQSNYSVQGPFVKFSITF